MELLKQITDATADQTKLKTYAEFYNFTDEIPKTSYSLTLQNEWHRKVVTKYITSSHDLESEKGRWLKIDKTQRICKQCNDNVVESIIHFIFECKIFNSIRNEYIDFPQNKTLYEFCNWSNYALVLFKLHNKRK